MKKIFNFFNKSINVLWYRHKLLVPPKYWIRYFKVFMKKTGVKFEYLNPFIVKEYNLWLKTNKCLSWNKQLHNKPLISIIIPVYNIEPIYLSECLDSILNQSYKNFEICIADDCSTKKETIEVLKKYEQKDERVRVVYRKTNGHISEATNSALEITKGDYIALMDDDDILDKNALYEVVKVINEQKDVDFIYTDEDKLDMEGNYCEPHFKSDFAIDSLFGGNYICHFTVLKKELFNEIGGFDKECVGAQDFDLFLRATEKAKSVYHIPKILYHWRKVPGSTADTIENKDYAIENGKKAVEKALMRRKLDGYVTVPIKCTHYVVHYNVKQKPLISIIMNNVDKHTIIKNLEQIFCYNQYQNIEVYINSKIKIHLNKYEDKFIKFVDEKNINNIINNAQGKFILLTNGRFKLESNCIHELIGYAMQKNIGAVGPKIYNFDKTIKSAGLILNSKNVFIDAFSNYFIDSVGFYGRLLVPYNYSAISNDFIVFEKRKYEKVNGFEIDVDRKISNIDFCLKLLQKGYRNIVLSHIYVKQKNIKNLKKYKINNKDKTFINNKWNLDNDIYYNSNLNKEYSFMLNIEKIKKKSKNKLLKFFYCLIMMFTILFSLYLIAFPIKKQVQVSNYDTMNKIEYEEFGSIVQQNIYINKKNSIGFLFILDENYIIDNWIISLVDKNNNLIYAKEISASEYNNLYFEVGELNFNENYILKIIDKDGGNIVLATTDSNGKTHLLNNEEKTIQLITCVLENDFSFLWYTLFVFVFMFTFYPYVWRYDNNEKK